MYTISCQTKNPSQFGRRRGRHSRNTRFLCTKHRRRPSLKIGEIKLHLRPSFPINKHLGLRIWRAKRPITFKRSETFKPFRRLSISSLSLINQSSTMIYRASRFRQVHLAPSPPLASSSFRPFQSYTKAYSSVMQQLQPSDELSTTAIRRKLFEQVPRSCTVSPRVFPARRKQGLPFPRFARSASKIQRAHALRTCFLIPTFSIALSARSHSGLLCLDSLFLIGPGFQALGNPKLLNPAFRFVPSQRRADLLSSSASRRLQ